MLHCSNIFGPDVGPTLVLQCYYIGLGAVCMALDIFGSVHSNTDCQWTILPEFLEIAFNVILSKNTAQASIYKQSHNSEILRPWQCSYIAASYMLCRILHCSHTWFFSRPSSFCTCENLDVYAAFHRKPPEKCIGVALVIMFAWNKFMADSEIFQIGPFIFKSSLCHAKHLTLLSLLLADSGDKTPVQTPFWPTHTDMR